MEKVYLNVYELIVPENKMKEISNSFLDFIGMGVHHSGIEVFGEEISFGRDPTERNDPKTDGVFIIKPRTAVGHFKEHIELGTVMMSRNDVYRVLDTIRPKWRAASYHILDHNCNCFTKAFAEALSPKLLEKYPSGINRPASVGSAVVPDALLASLTDALGPPGCAPSDLVNKIHIVVPGPPPPPLIKAPPKKKEAGGFFGAIKGAASAVSGALASVVDASDIRDMKKQWPEYGEKAETNLVAAYQVNVLHVNRVQKADVFVTKKDGLFFSGNNSLHFRLGYEWIASMHFAATIDPPERHMQPSFLVAFPPPGELAEMFNVPPSWAAAFKHTEVSAIVLFLADRTTPNQSLMIPMLDIGTVSDKTVGFVFTGGDSPLARMMRYMDEEWRKCAPR